MPELPFTHAAGSLRALDTAATDARSLLRRAHRLAELVGQLDREMAERQAQEVVEALEHILATLDESRAAERQRLRGRLRGSDEP